MLKSRQRVTQTLNQIAGHLLASSLQSVEYQPIDRTLNCTDAAATSLRPWLAVHVTALHRTVNTDLQGRPIQRGATDYRGVQRIQGGITDGHSGTRAVGKLKIGTAIDNYASVTGRQKTIGPELAASRELMTVIAGATVLLLCSH